MTILRRRMTEDMRIRNLSSHTQASYLQQVTQFARYFGKSPDKLGAEDIRLHGRATGMQGAFDQPRVGLGIGAERDYAGDAGFLCAALEVSELRRVAVKHSGAVRLEPEKDLGLRIGDLGQ